MTLIPADDLIKGQHNQYADHFFKGVCICSCKDCVSSSTKDKVVCSCVDCPYHLCGAKEAGPSAEVKENEGRLLP